MPTPVDNEDLFDGVVLGGVKSPGKVTLSGHDRKITWDVKAGSGQSGATTTLKAVPPIEFTATFYLVQDPAQDVDDFDGWDAFRDAVESTVSGPKPKALDIYHPDLADNGITSVCKASMGGPVYDGKGGTTIVVKFQEYKPPKPKGGSPKGAKADAKADPDKAAKDELARLTKQFQNTPWG